ncbi:tyrosine-type recombinase/integrase [Dongia rigui]|uniref:Tyrosine-type recombinase/integrase n=1 Tax=Dongia rigui TaxID=940149 RepID=A0ABU5DUL5_9PROT|nr:tyrosine-type recombinase/integrase [Dongia rigui]MDY0870635.1 tyrosine-type recombinase/integrase [Dongia rigui]
MLLKLKFIWRVTSKGRTYTYYRRGNEAIRINGEVGSATFFEHYRQIHTRFEKSDERPGAKVGSLKALIENYKETHQYLITKPKTKKSYLRYLNHLEEKYGHLPVATLPRPFVVALRDKHQSTPRTANGFIQAMSILMNRAKEIGWINHNPAEGVKLLETGDGHRPWEESEIEAFRACWALGTLERTAYEIALNTGQRGIDCVNMERGHVGDGVISVMQSKTGERVWVPISHDLQVALDAWYGEREKWIADRLDRRNPLPVPLDVKTMILTGKRGRELAGEGTFSHLLNDAYKAVPGLSTGLHFDAAKSGVTSHGLRYTAATRLHELGCSKDVIASITGHDTIAMVEKYIQKKRKAQIAISSLDEATAAQNSNQSVKPL